MMRSILSAGLLMPAMVPSGPGWVQKTEYVPPRRNDAEVIERAEAKRQRKAAKLARDHHCKIDKA